jgi:hypothetical protein
VSVLLEETQSDKCDFSSWDIQSGSHWSYTGRQKAIKSFNDINLSSFVVRCIHALRVLIMEIFQCSWSRCKYEWSKIYFTVLEWRVYVCAFVSLFAGKIWILLIRLTRSLCSFPSKQQLQWWMLLRVIVSKRFRNQCHIIFLFQY